MKEAHYNQQIQDAVAEYLPEGFDWRIIKAQAWQESRFDAKAVSVAGAKGIMQIMPGTWDMLGGTDIYDPHENIRLGVKYLADRYSEWSWPRPEIDRIALALASYNAGMGHILKAQRMAGDATGYAEIIGQLDRVTGRHAQETKDYVRHILWFWIREVITP